MIDENLISTWTSSCFIYFLSHNVSNDKSHTALAKKQITQSTTKKVLVSFDYSCLFIFLSYCVCVIVIRQHTYILILSSYMLQGGRDQYGFKAFSLDNLVIHTFQISKRFKVVNFKCLFKKPCFTIFSSKIS